MFAMGPAFYAHGASYATLALSGTFAAATVGSAYSSSIPISGGLEPYSLTGGTGVVSGSLDSGFSLSITGTTGARFLTLTCASPATADTMTFTASVDSSDAQTATSAQSVVVSSAGTVVSLLHFDGASGGTTFTDEVGKVWTPTNTTLSTAIKEFGTAAGNFTAAGQALISTPNSADFNFGSGDFTLECFLYIVGASKSSSNHTIFSNLTDSPAQGFRCYLNSARIPQIVNMYGPTGTTHAIFPSLAIPLNTWTHVAWTRSGTTCQTFVGGVLDGQDNTTSGAITDSVYSMQMGNLKYVNSWGLNGYIDEARVTKGYARYTSSFTPPTAPFTYP